MDLFTYLLAKNDKFSLVHKSDLFAYLLGKNNSIPLKTAEGVHITIEALKTKINELKMMKESTQDGTPTPSNPVPVEVVEGHIKDGNNYVDVKVTGKNLFNKNNVVDGYLLEDGTVGGGTAYKTSDYIPISPNTNYYKTRTGSPRSKYYDINKQPLNTTTYQDIDIGTQAGTFITPANAYYVRLSIYPQTISLNDVQLEQGSIATSYEPYKESIVPIPLNGNFIGGIGDNLDELIVDKFGKCYLKKVITKIDSYNGETITTEYMSTTGGLDIGATIYYVTPSQLIDLNYTIDLKLFKGENNISNSEDMMMTLKYY